MQSIAISSLYNWVLKDPILDWLDAYGEASGFKKDTSAETYLAAADYGLFVRTLASEFEDRVLALIRQRVDVLAITGAQSNQDDFYRQTLRLINEGQEAIYQGLVRDPDLELFGVPDLIIRGSAIEKLAPGTLGELDPNDYYILDIKFKGLDLNKRGDLKSSHSWERVQLALYERALASMLGRQPSKAFVVGRRVSGEERSKGGCFDVIPWVTPLDDKGLASVGDGLAWLSDMREHGAAWTLQPPSDSRLLPNAKNTQDSPWHEVKKSIFRKAPQEPWVGPHIQPERIEANRREWFEREELEFFVDYETFNGMNDDFTSLPGAGGRPMIFMIGCGHEEEGEWQFSVWTAASESYEEERRVVDAWLTHMESVRLRLAPEQSAPPTFHWHSHEVRELEKAANRHDNQAWLSVNWRDLLWKVFKAEPVRIVHTDSQSLKPITRKLKELGHVKTEWGEGPVADGLAAMTAAWNCYAAAREQNLSVHEALTFQGRSLMGEIEKYNEVDCRAMWEILLYLRKHH